MLADHRDPRDRLREDAVSPPLVVTPLLWIGRLLVRVGPIRFTFLVAIAIVVLGVFGSSLLGDPWPWDIDSEGNLPAAFSSALFVCVASVALAVQREVGGAGDDATTLITVFAALFVFFALDEFLVVHEHLEILTGLDWTLLYLPLYVLCALAALRLMLVLDGRSRLLFMAGAAMLAAVPLLEALEYDGAHRVSSYPVLMALEELVAEMGGAAVITLSLVTYLRRRRASTS